MKFKTKPMAHQLAAYEAMRGRNHFALLMEQGTGKTKVAIDDAARCFGDGVADAMIVFAPNGVHTKWVTIELPKHMPDWCPYVAAFYSSGASKRHKASIEKLYERDEEGSPKRMRVLTINFDALSTKEGVAVVDRFLSTFNAVGIVDESQRIKNPAAVRTKFLHKRKRLMPIRRILTGTPITKSPFDAFGQYYFLDGSILRTESFTAFKTEYAEMLDEKHYLVRKLQQGAWARKDGSASTRVPQIIARNDDGQPVYRNLDKLNRLIMKHSYRVLKADCLDLPEKVYDTVQFELTDRQRTVYEKMRKDHRASLDQVIDAIAKDGKRNGLTPEEAMLMNHELILNNKLVAMAKLQQITCGYLKLEDKSVVRMFKKLMDNPRNAAMMEQVEDTEGQMIFWAPHRDKIDQIIEMLREGYSDAQIVRYDGAASKQERMDGIDAFQAGQARFFVGNPQSGGAGITLTAAETTFYYSNSFNLEHRLQSEDRNHRIGTTGSVRYFDMEALDTVDRVILESNVYKKSIADMITGDSNI